MRKEPLTALLGLCSVLVAGCASASPIDFLIPTPVVPATTNYLGHVTPPKMNGMYHSLRDSKNEKALLAVRKVELDALYQVADNSNGLVIAAINPISTGLWALILAGAASIGLITPKPGTAAKIREAGLKDPEEFKKSL